MIPFFVLCAKFCDFRVGEFVFILHCSLSFIHQVIPVPLIIHSVVVSFSTTARPFAARLRVPVVPAPARRKVSVTTAMEITPALSWLMIVNLVPIAYGAVLFAGICQVRAVVSADGCRNVRSPSPMAKVFAAEIDSRPGRNPENVPAICPLTSLLKLLQSKSL